MGDRDYLWDPSAPADPELERLENALRGYRLDQHVVAGARRAIDADVGSSIPSHAPSAMPPRSRRHVVLRGAVVRWGLAASVALAAVLTTRAASRQQLRPWQVSIVEGTPRVAGAPMSAPSDLRPGAWLETDSATTAELNVGSIGKAVVGPSSRLLLLRAAGTEHRLALAHGTLHARIWAPPRFFLVETPSALAVDLGCVYTLTVDARGAGVLHVESGEVELVHGRNAVLVPSGNRATLLPGGGVGLPTPGRADSAYVALVAAAESSVGDSAVIVRLIDASDARHTITLWHLIGRTEGRLRAMVIDRLAQVAPLPANISRSAVTAADPSALAAWRDAIDASWASEPVPAWKRMWRRLWRAIPTTELG